MPDSAGEFVPPAGELPPDLPLESGIPVGNASSPQPGEDDAFWIVSSRSVRQPAGAPESSLDLAYLQGVPNGLVRQPRERFLGSLRPDRPVCVVIHGSYNYWPDVLRESRRCREWIARAAHGQPVQLVYFTWPASGYAPLVFPVELAVMGRRAAYHGVYLANLLCHFPPEQPVCLVGHSHGARCVVASLHALGGGAVEDGTRLAPGLTPPQRLRAVLLAAAIDHHWLNPGGRYGRALFPIEKVLIVHNQADAWLQVYSWKNLLGNSSALGQSGLSPADHFQLASLNGKVVLLDGTRLTGNNHDFNAFNTRAEYADAIAPMVTFADAPPSEHLPGDPAANSAGRSPGPRMSGSRAVGAPAGPAPVLVPRDERGAPLPTSPRSSRDGQSTRPIGDSPVRTGEPAPAIAHPFNPKSPPVAAGLPAPNSTRPPLSGRMNPALPGTRGRITRRPGLAGRNAGAATPVRPGLPRPAGQLVINGSPAASDPSSRGLPARSPITPPGPGTRPTPSTAGQTPGGAPPTLSRDAGPVPGLADSTTADREPGYTERMPILPASQRRGITPGVRRLPAPLAEGETGVESAARESRDAGPAEERVASPAPPGGSPPRLTAPAVVPEAATLEIQPAPGRD